LSIAFARMGNSIDSSTYANIEEVRTEALDLQLKVNFDDKTFEGFAEHDLEILVNGTTIVYFDVVGMDITDIEQYGQKNTSYGVHWPLKSEKVLTNPKLGYSLAVHLHHPGYIGDKIYVKISYKTNNESTAVSWLTKEQTHDKTMTYLYSQCEDIACRSIAPLQDTPANKFTYTASITVDTGFIVKMSATDINSVVNETDKTTTFNFE